MVPLIGLLVILITAAVMGWWIMRSRRFAAPGSRFTLRQYQQQAREQRRLPYRYADDYVFIVGNTIWTGLILPDFTDEFATTNEGENNAITMESFDQAILDVLGNQAVDVHDLLRYRKTDSSEWHRDLIARLWRPSARFTQLLRRAGHLADESAPQRVLMRFVCLGRYTSTHKETPLDRGLVALTGVNDELFTADDLTPYHELVTRLRNAVRVRGARPMTRNELLWAIRKTFVGHLEPTDMGVVPTHPWGAGFFDVVGSFRGINHGTCVELTGPGGEKSYVATVVTITKPPFEIYSAGSTWLQQLKAAGHLVELSDRFRLIPAHEWAEFAKRMYNNVIDEAVDREKAGAYADAGFTSKVQRAEELKARMQTGASMPARRGRTRIILTAPTIDRLEVIVSDTMRVLGQRGWTVACPDLAQYLLLEESLPGEAPQQNLGAIATGQLSQYLSGDPTKITTGGIPYWEHVTDTFPQAVGGIASHNVVGDRVEYSRGERLGHVGPYIARMVTTGAPVHFSPHVQIERNKGAGIGIFGASGNGKSMLAMMLFYSESESGTACVVLDLKNDFESFCYYLSFGPQVLDPGFTTAARQGLLTRPDSPYQPVDRDFWSATSIIDLADGQRGLLDPWRITGTWAEGETLARAAAALFFPRDEECDVVTDAINLMKLDLDDADKQARPFQVGLARILPYIERDLAALRAKQREAEASDKTLTQAETQQLRLFTRVYRRLETLQEVSFGRLLFGDGTTTGPRYGSGRIIDPERRRTIFTMHGFTPPQGDDHAAWDEPTRYAAAAVQAALTAVLDAFDSTSKPHPATGRMQIPPRTIYIDEAKMLLQVQAGRVLMAKGLRQGRSLGLCVVIITQQAKDLNDLEQLASDGNPDVNQIATIFAFANEGAGEALSALRVLRSTDGLSDGETRRMSELLLAYTRGGSLFNGACAIRDVDNRIGIARITPVFDELRRAAQTNPVLASIDKAIPLPLDPADWTLLTPRTEDLTPTEDEVGTRERLLAQGLGVDFAAPADDWTQHTTDDGDEGGEGVQSAYFDPVTEKPPVNVGQARNDESAPVTRVG